MEDLRDWIEEDDTIVKAPFYMIVYKDDRGQTHMANITNLEYLHYIEKNFVIIEKKYIEI